MRCTHAESPQVIILAHTVVGHVALKDIRFASVGFLKLITTSSSNFSVGIYYPPIIAKLELGRFINVHIYIYMYIVHICVP